MYKLISKKYFIENISYIGYGIATIDETVRIEDINTEKGEIEKLIERCKAFREPVVEFFTNAYEKIVE